jgi:hypothetical protein
MPTRGVGVTDTASASNIVEVNVLEHGSIDLTTTTTADPGAAGTTLAIVSAADFPSSGSYKIRVENEIMLVTAGQGTTSWTVTRGLDNTSAVAHTTGVTVAFIVATQYVIPMAPRVTQYKGMVTTFRTPGRAATAQNLFSIFNASTKALVAVRRMSLQVDQTVVRLTVAPSINVARQTVVATNGTALTPVPFDSTSTLDANVTVRGDASANGTGSTTTLTSTPAATKAWTQYPMRENTLVGQTLYPDDPLIPALCADDPIILRASEGLLVHIIAAATTDNPATAFYQINCMFEVYTEL